MTYVFADVEMDGWHIRLSKATEGPRNQIGWLLSPWVNFTFAKDEEFLITFSCRVLVN